MPRLALLLAALALPAPAPADERAPGTVAVGARVFLAPGQPDRQPSGRPPADDEWMHVDLDLSDMDWFRALLEADPLVGPLRPWTEVTRLPDPPAVVLGDARVLGRFGDRERVPAHLRLDGYDVQTVSGQVPPREFNLRPAGPAPDFKMECSLPEPERGAGAFEYCKLMATYPPDPSIMLAARMYRPPPLGELAPELPAVVARLREAAQCLDVTDAPPADPEAALAALLAENPTLTGCTARLSS